MYFGMRCACLYMEALANNLLTMRDDATDFGVGLVVLPAQTAKCSARCIMAVCSAVNSVDII